MIPSQKLQGKDYLWSKTLDIEAIKELTHMVSPLAVAMAISVTRILGIMAILPLFSWAGVQGLVKGGIAITLSIPVIWNTYDSILTTENTIGIWFSILVAKEFFIGMIIGAAFGVPFWIVQAAGSYIDSYRGSSIASLFDPSFQNETSPFGVFLTLSLIIYFLQANGFALILSATYESYELWPVISVPSISNTVIMTFIIKIFTYMFFMTLTYAAPMLIAMFLGEMAVALASRFATQINAFDLSFAIKNMIFIATIPIYITFLNKYLSEDYNFYGQIWGLVKKMFSTE